jgi:hypothetical protein
MVLTLGTKRLAIYIDHAPCSEGPASFRGRPLGYGPSLAFFDDR